MTILRGRIVYRDGEILASPGTGRFLPRQRFKDGCTESREMKILVINPNTSEEFNRKLSRAAREFALPSTEVRVISPSSGPKSIEGIYDEALSVQGTLEAFIDHEKEFDGFVLACYSDPLTVYAMREIIDETGPWNRRGLDPSRLPAREQVQHRHDQRPVGTAAS